MADDLNPPLTPLGARALGARTHTASALWRPVRRRRGWIVASAAVLAGSLVWLGWPSAEPAEALVVHRSSPPPLPAFVAPEPPPAAPEPIVLEDGSTIQLRTTSAALRTHEQTDERVRLRLSGGAHFDVAPEPAPSFVVESPQVLVRVLGTTAFSVDPEDARTRVAVERGRVQIMWWRGATILRAGESALFPPENESAFGRSAPRAKKSMSAARPKHAAKRKKAHRTRAVEARAGVRESSGVARARVRQAHGETRARDRMASGEVRARVRGSRDAAHAPSPRPHKKAAGRHPRRARHTRAAH